MEAHSLILSAEKILGARKWFSEMTCEDLNQSRDLLSHLKLR